MKRLVIAAAAIFAINVALNAPLFMPGDSPYRDSIEAGYKGMSRFLTEHPNAWGWNPLQYCGLPTQFTYVPALHYTTAAASSVFGAEPAYMYRLITAALACLGPVTLMLFSWFFTRSLLWAILTALICTFFSPLYGLVRQVDTDRGLVYLPWRLHVFAKYGESPHISALALIPLAVLAAWIAAHGKKRWHMPAAASLFAAVTLTNWVAALALAIFTAVFLLAAAGRSGEARLGRFFVIGGLAYALACFWLTPSFIYTVAFNWPLDAFNYKLQMTQRWLLVTWVVGLVALRWFAGWLRWPLYQTFVALGVFAFGCPVLIHYSYGLDMFPESRRYAPEFEMFLILALVSYLQLCFAGGNRVRHFCGVLVAMPLSIAAWPQAWTYASQGYDRWKPVPSQQTAEYKVAKWIFDQKPRGRVLASGGLRFRLNSWFDLQQVGGAFESGLRNRVPVDVAYQIRTGAKSTPETDAADSIRQMVALGVEYVVIHGPRSAEHYRDYKNTLKFEGVLERVYAGEDDFVYRVPFRSLAHLVRSDEQPRGALSKLVGAYTAAALDTSRPALEFEWRGPDTIEVGGPIPPGHDVVLAVTHDSGWRAWQDGTPVVLEPNKLNFIVVKAKPSNASTIRVQYTGTAEQFGFGALAGLSWLATGWYIWRHHRAGR